MLILNEVLLSRDAFTLRADMQIAPGMIAVIGPSGSGKSTLLAAIAGFLQPVSGDMTWNGQSILGLAPGQRPVTMLFQDHNLFPHLTVAQNVGLALVPRLRLSQKQADRVSTVLFDVGLSKFATRKPADLSGGQIGRAALARSLLSDRPIVLLDEAFAALGPALRSEMLGLVRDRMAMQGRTVVVVTHDPQDARTHADSIIFVDDGIAHAPHPVATFFDNPGPAVKAYLG